MLTFQVILIASVSPQSIILTKLSTNHSRPDLVLVSNNSIILTNTQQHLYWLQELWLKEDRYGLTVDLISIDMPETLAQVATTCCVCKVTVWAGTN